MLLKIGPKRLYRLGGQILSLHATPVQSPHMEYGLKYARSH